MIVHARIVAFTFARRQDDSRDGCHRISWPAIVPQVRRGVYTTPERRCLSASSSKPRQTAYGRATGHGHEGRHFHSWFRVVGKTSLAYTAAGLIQSSDRQPIYVQCSPDATLTSFNRVMMSIPTGAQCARGSRLNSACGGIRCGR